MQLVPTTTLHRPGCGTTVQQQPCRSRPVLRVRSSSTGQAVPTSSQGTDSSIGTLGDVLKGAETFCLKEWAVTCAALGAGKQTVLLRKGGIREPKFVPAAKRFLLFPTAFHTDAQLLKPGVAEQFAEELLLQPREVEQLPLQYFAEVTGAWTTRDPQVLQVLDALHVYSDDFLDTRLKWRAQEPLTLLELRCYRVQPPVMIPVKQREGYFGCFSFVQLQQEDRVAASGAQLQPALTAEQFEQKQQLLRAGLQQLQAEVLDLGGLS